MKLTIESTTKVVTVNGVFARIWEGTTDGGIPVHCYITRVAVPASPTGLDDDVATQFARELEVCRSPSAEVAAIPARLIL